MKLEKKPKCLHSQGTACHGNVNSAALSPPLAQAEGEPALTATLQLLLSLD